MTKERKMELVHQWNSTGSPARFRDELRNAATAEGVMDADISSEFVAWLFGERVATPLEDYPTNASVHNVARVVEGIYTATTIREAFAAIKNSGCTLRDPSNLVQMPPEDMWRFVNEVLNGVAKPYARYSPGQQNLINMIIDVYSRELSASRGRVAA
jgi:hypothetical protein